MLRRVQLKRLKGWKLPANTVSVTRGGKSPRPFSNPFVVRWLDGEIAGTPGWPPPPTKEKIRAELRGKNLACFCPLDQPCHADVLLKIANAETD
jgi:hypothetical protein